MTGSLGTFSQDAAGRQEASRELLQRPFLTAARDPELLTLIRKHAPALKSMFLAELGYTLIVESTFARLIKSPPEPTAPTRAMRSRSGSPLGASSYALLALTCAALLAPGTADRLSLSSLVEQIASDAVDQRIGFSTAISDRRALAGALHVLTEWGVVVDPDGAVAKWTQNPSNDQFITVDRAVLEHVLARPIGPVADRFAVVAAAEDDARRRLQRRLVENPVLLLGDLTTGESDVLTHHKTELARRLDENFGLTLEVRAEGALAYDAEGRLSDIEFPGSGSLRHAALLLIGGLVDRIPDPVAGEALSAPWPLVEKILADAVADNTSSWKSEYVDSASTLRSDVTELLSDLGLAESSEDHLTLHAHAARYRPTLGTRP